MLFIALFSFCAVTCFTVFYIVLTVILHSTLSVNTTVYCIMLRKREREKITENLFCLPATPTRGNSKNSKIKKKKSMCFGGLSSFFFLQKFHAV